MNNVSHLNFVDFTIGRKCNNSKFIKKILDENKNNISALCLELDLDDVDYPDSDDEDYSDSDDVETKENFVTDLVSFLRHKKTVFRSLEKLSIASSNFLLKDLLKKHEQLIYLNYTWIWSDNDINLSDLPKFHKLETLIVQYSSIDDLVPLISSCSNSLSKLELHHIEDEYFCTHQTTKSKSYKQIPKLPKLETYVSHFKTFDCDGDTDIEEFGSTLLSRCRQSLTRISFHVTTFDMEDTYFPSVKYLQFYQVPGECVNDFISGHACQLETLLIDEIHDLKFSDPFPKIKNVWVNNCKNVPDLLKCASSLQCLVLGYCPDLEGTTKMPNLTDLYLIDYEYDGMSFVEESISKLLVNNADTLQFLVLRKPYRTESKVKRLKIERTSVELKNVHTVIVVFKNDPLEIDRDFLHSLCPNAQIMITGVEEEDKREHIIETLNSRLKYLKADDELFRNALHSKLFRRY